MKRRKTILLAVDLAAVALLTYFDQFTKYLAVFHLKGKPDIPILKDILVLQYLENKGAAFGMLQNQKIFFLLIEILILLVIGFALVKMPADKKYNLMHLTAVLVAGGAIGNMVCVNNIVSVCATTGTNGNEGKLIRTNIVPCMIYCAVVATVVGIFLAVGINPMPELLQ